MHDMTEAVNERFEQLKNKILIYNSGCDLELLEKAYRIAFEAHAGQMRLSGEPYIIHPVEVAHIIAEMELDCEAVTAAILHDTVEDTSITVTDIKNIFGTNVALLVEGVTKLGKIPHTTKEEQQVENLRKMFLAMSKDIRVILIKLADRLHNMRTLKSQNEEKQRKIALETMHVFSPLAHRLGMQKIKWELEDISLRYLDPIAYHEITEFISTKRAERESNIENVKNTLKDKLKEMNIKAHIEGRAKHFYSIYRKMVKNNYDFNQIYDLLAVRVIVDSISECYAVLGMVHELYKPIPGRFKDYIAMPKKNMYQSLHTSLIGPDGKPFEIQIRTWEMHRISEVGIAAHWKYKEGKTGTNELDSKLEWVRQLLEIHKDLTDTEEFMNTLKIDLFDDEVFVFSPKGDVINLPTGSTPIDFAYSIHSAIGNKTTGAKINGKIVPIDYKLVNGDIVEIITSTVSHGPSRDWLKIVKTAQARKKINDWFKKEHREENIERGKEEIEKELKRNGISLSILNEKKIMSVVCKKFTVATTEDLFATVGYGGIPVKKAVGRIREECHASELPKNSSSEVITNQKSQHHKSSNGIIVNGLDNCMVRFSRCCNPVPGDDIVGYITRGRGVSVHRKDCLNVHNAEHGAKNDEVRFIDVWWDNNLKSTYVADLKVIANNRENLLLEIANVLSNLKLNVMSLNARTLKNDLSIIQFSVEIHDVGQLDTAMKNLRKISDVTQVTRTKQ